MSIEFNGPTNLTEMRQVAHDWVIYRPTIKHTHESIRTILKNELDELHLATLNHTESEITSEIGDVFFTMLAIDDGQTHEFDSDYKFFAEYAESVGLNLITLFKATHHKNQVNYPITFFNQMSPFIDVNDAFSCLRILRKATGHDIEILNLVWLQLDIEINQKQPCFFDRGHSHYIFRDFIKRYLNTIFELTDDQNLKQEIKRLKLSGQWDYSDLDIPNNRFNWYRLIKDPLIRA